MEWVDDGLVIGIRHHGETGVIAELLTRERGRHSGFVHGGRSRRLRPALQPGNDVRATWTARGEEQLGTLVVEPLTLRAGRLMETALALHGANLLCALLRLLPEREPQPALHAAATAILDGIEEPTAPATMVRFELMVLVELGFGLDLARCAVTGTADDLAYVSPKTGRAVTRAVGEPYRDRALALPAFLQMSDGGPLAAAPTEDVLAGFRLTEHFLRRDVFAPRGLTMPHSRAAYVRAAFDAGHR